jgi:hypothetical protein
MAKVPEAVEELVERFGRNAEAYRSSAYNEEQLRVEFINPFWKALGWDVENEAGHALAYRDVLHEEALPAGGGSKAPDYCFRIGGMRKFFVEAKRPSVDLKSDSSPAYQLRRYAWSAKLPLSVLTDFEEFAVYGCTVRPKPTDKASVARILYLGYGEYAERWSEVASVFAREAVLRGDFDRFAEGKRPRRGTTEVDAEFLREIERWREELARNFALRNPGLSVRDLNFAVQKTIDRIIFLRMCEDRGIEDYSQLQALVAGPSIYPRLVQIYRRADQKYNSGLFHFEAERDRAEAPDELTPNLSLDDKVLKDILGGLYYPQSPYEFSVLPVEILGNVYEQFLGKVIRLTAGHHAKVEEKPGVRKAGGVYYTPKYIVDYIVKQTVGKLLEGKTVAQASELRILDPACGSGSFLLGAYQYLLDWHRDRYFEQMEKTGKVPAVPTGGNGRRRRGDQPALYEGPGGEWRLTTTERKRILLNNIYGVDIDAQAVEVTKLSLLLKVLERENRETLEKQLRIFRERALPDLGKNIRCGNSLIGPDFSKGRQMSLLDEEEVYRINPFDWTDRERGFGDIMSAGGFDAVIGNPPWVMAGYVLGEEIAGLKKTYISAYGKFDLYYCFLELSLRLVTESGMLGVIVPNKFFHAKAATNLRGLLAAQGRLAEIVDFGDAKVFAGATNYSCILVFGEPGKDTFLYRRAQEGLATHASLTVRTSHLCEKPWVFESREETEIFHKMEECGVPLDTLVSRFGTGVQTGADRFLTFERDDVRLERFEKGLLRPILRGRDVRRYRVNSAPKMAIFPYREDKGEFRILCEDELSRFPVVEAYLERSKEELRQRVWFGKGAVELSGHWYGFMYLDRLGTFASAHLLTPSLSDRSNFALGEGDVFVTGTAGVTSILPAPETREDIRYLLGLLNSSCMSFYCVKHSPVFSGGFYKFSGPYLSGVPIRRIDFSNPDDVNRHDRMVELVERMLNLHRRLPEAKTPDEKTMLDRQIAATDREIDQLVYELYGLTDEEIRIVEEGGG